MARHEHIQRLNKRLAAQDETIRKLSVLNKALRKANPEMALVYEERESLKRMVEMHQEELEKAATLGGAILKSLQNPVNGGGGFTLGDQGLTLKSGASTWAPQLSVEKVRAEDEAAEVRRAANRLALEGSDNLAMLKARELRKKRERGAR